jgi:hypothetical protein
MGFGKHKCGSPQLSTCDDWLTHLHEGNSGLPHLCLPNPIIKLVTLSSDTPVISKHAAVRLINFDWSGAVRVAKFPNDVNISAFDSRALSLCITGGQIIPKNFDWHYLTDIFENAGLPEAEQSALDLHATQML